jgi:hypothetical protein
MRQSHNLTMPEMRTSHERSWAAKHPACSQAKTPHGPLRAAVDAICLAAVLCVVGCSSLTLDTCCVPASSLPPFRTIEIVGAGSSLHGRPIEDNKALVAELRRELKQEFPAASIVDSDADIQIMFVMVDYVPGCRPDCRRFSTYRNWTGEVMTWIPGPESNTVSGSQVVAISGTTYNPLHRPVREFVRQFKRYWRGAGHTA